MSELLKKENIQIQQRAEDWKSAIYMAVSPLVEHGYVEERYADEIINNTYEFGPYYVIAPDVALLHARPEQGVLKTQLAIMVLREPIKFSPEGYDVRLVITLATTDNQSHLKILRKIGQILSDEEATARIIASSSVDEIYSMFALEGGS